jgi:hypothetical protein
MQEDVILAKIEAISDRQGDVIDSIGRIDDRLIDLTKTVTNHINSDIASDNKRSISKAPNWMLVLFVFFLGRVSMEVVDFYEKIHEPTPIVKTIDPNISKASINAPSSTLVATKPRKSLNNRIDDKVINKLIGDE